MQLADKLTHLFDAPAAESCFHTTLSVVFITPVGDARTPTRTSAFTNREAEGKDPAPFETTISKLRGQLYVRRAP
jgi:hypothetical protein